MEGLVSELERVAPKKRKGGLKPKPLSMRQALTVYDDKHERKMSVRKIVKKHRFSNTTYYKLLKMAEEARNEKAL